MFMFYLVLLHLVLPVNGATFENNQPSHGFIQRCLLSIVSPAQARHISS